MLFIWMDYLMAVTVHQNGYIQILNITTKNCQNVIYSDSPMIYLISVSKDN